jgi:hypothetical protein
MSASLYEISANYLSALDFITDPDQDIDAQTSADTLEAVEGVLDDKLLNVARYIASLEHQALGIKEAEQRQAARRKAIENKAELLRDYLKTHMEQTGHTKINAPDISIGLAKLPASVQIDDEALIPEMFWRVDVKRSVDKPLIKTANGCPGARVESSGYRVSIK